MGRRPNIARMPLAGSGAPEIQVMKYATGQTFSYQALVIEDANGEITEAGADPSTVLGLSLGAAGNGPGYNMANDNITQFVTGRAQEVPIAILNRNTVWSIRGINGATDPVTPAITHLNVQYGVAKTAGGDWVLDIAEVTAKVFEVVDVDIDNLIFFVKPLESILQRP